MTDPRTIAAGLTIAQRRAVVTLGDNPKAQHSDEQIFIDYTRAGIRQRRTRQFLTNSGITEPYRSGPVTMWSMIRLSTLGHSVRACLMEDDRGDR